MPVLPLTVEQTTEYNNVATTPPTAPLGDIINELTALIPGGGMEDVADTFDCPPTVAIGDAVYFSASNTVDKASAASGGGQTAAAIGVVLSKPTAIRAKVLSAGSADVYVGLVPGSRYFVSPTTAGGLTTTPPVASGEVLQQIGRAATGTKLLVLLFPENVLL